MKLIWEMIQFLVYSLLVVGIAKYILVPILRKLGESLNLKPKTIGFIAGIATSVPELLTVSFSAFSGLIEASSYNILSSNIINTIQYTASIALNKNGKKVRHPAIIVALVFVVITIIIPLLLLLWKIDMKFYLVPIFLISFVIIYFIDRRVYLFYFKNLKTEEEKEIEEEEKKMRGKEKITILYAIFLLLSSIALFVVGNLLGGTLENLCYYFHIPEVIIGILLGFVTSLPELITFLESQKHYKKEIDQIAGVVEATNNLLTSNLLNLFIIQASGITIYTLLH
ncbi:MAG: hypothetical protein ACLU8F_02295 [Clostridia bacterium]